jgi:hypothetical protein
MQPHEDRDSIQRCGHRGTFAATKVAAESRECQIYEKKQVSVSKGRGRVSSYVHNIQGEPEF